MDDERGRADRDRWEVPAGGHTGYEPPSPDDGPGWDGVERRERRRSHGQPFLDDDHNGIDDRFEAEVERRRAARADAVGRYRDILGTDEALLLHTRQHPLVLLARSAPASAMAALGVVAFAIALSNEAAADLAYLVSAVVGGPAIIYLWWRWLAWKREEYLVTDRRVVRMRGILNQTIDETALEKVNDMRQRQSFLGRILGYGDLEILSAAEDRSAIDEFRMIRDAGRFRMTVNEAKARWAGEDWAR